MQHGTSPSPRFPRLRLAIWAAAGLYAAAVVALACLFHYRGERDWFLIPLLFMPVQLWLSPLLLLLPAALAFNRRALVLLGVPVLVTLFGIGGLRLGGKERAPTPGARVLKVLTYNTGESNGTRVAPFAREQSPDLILLQDVKSRRFSHLIAPGFYHRVLEGFVVISRFPIRSAKRIDSGRPEWNTPIAAAFVIDWEGVPITAYSVHVPTLRDEYARLREGRDPVPSRQRLRVFRERMRNRLVMNEQFARVVNGTRGPVIVAGDFNMPSWGYLHGRFCRRLTDCFEKAGRGFGFTFPGFDPQLPTFFGKWLRLDYVFCNAAWKPLSCTVEEKRASQHQAVAATLELTAPAQDRR